MRRIRVPAVVSLHEVYAAPPDVFPRENVSGPFPIRNLKLLAYDMRHPAQTALRRHRARAFGAAAIAVHGACHRDILTAQGIAPERIHVIHYPFPEAPAVDRPAFDGKAPLQAGTVGFVNRSFDFDLLFDTLLAYGRPWRFTWIGGARRESDNAFVDSLRTRVSRLKLADRFSITGWVSDEERDRLLRSLHVYCAFFRHRSSSESLAVALAARRFVLASPQPFIEELVSRHRALFLVPRDRLAAAAELERIAGDPQYRGAIASAMDDCVAELSASDAARQTMSLYRTVLGI